MAGFPQSKLPRWGMTLRSCWWEVSKLCLWLAQRSFSRPWIPRFIIYLGQSSPAATSVLCPENAMEPCNGDTCLHIIASAGFFVQIGWRQCRPTAEGYMSWCLRVCHSWGMRYGIFFRVGRKQMLFIPTWKVEEPRPEQGQTSSTPLYLPLSSQKDLAGALWIPVFNWFVF